MGSHITWPYQIADHYCRITWVYNKYPNCFLFLIICTLPCSGDTQTRHNFDDNASMILASPTISITIIGLNYCVDIKELFKVIYCDIY